MVAAQFLQPPANELLDQIVDVEAHNKTHVGSNLIHCEICEIDGGTWQEIGIHIWFNIFPKCAMYKVNYDVILAQNKKVCSHHCERQGIIDKCATGSSSSKTQERPQVKLTTRREERYKVWIMECQRT